MLEACDDWYSGAYLLETVPSVLYILMRHAHDPEEAIVRAASGVLVEELGAGAIPRKRRKASAADR